MIQEHTLHETPNQEVVASQEVREQYRIVRSVENYDRYGWEGVELVIFDQGDAKKEHETAAFTTIYNVVAIAREYEHALNFVEDHLGLSVEDQKVEMSHIDLSGQNGKYLFMYLCEDAPGWSVIYSMYCLHDVGGYNFDAMMDQHFQV